MPERMKIELLIDGGKYVLFLHKSHEHTPEAIGAQVAHTIANHRGQVMPVPGMEPVPVLVDSRTDALIEGVAELGT